MKLERYLERFREIGKEEGVIDLIREEAEPLIKKYNSLPLTLPVTDEPMRRLCQVLTNNNFITFDSCEGHGRRLPYVSFFLPRNNRSLGRLAYVISRASGSPGKHFNWGITVNASPGSIPAYRRYYDIEVLGIKPADPKTDYEKLLEDVDILGISILDHFDELRK